MSGWLIYWITRLDSIMGCAIVLSILGGIGCVVYIVWRILEGVHYEGTYSSSWGGEQYGLARKAIGRVVIPIFVAGLLVAVFIPTTKEACAIYLIPKIANNEQVQKVPEQALRLLNAKLEEWIDDQIGTEPEPEQP